MRISTNQKIAGIALGAVAVTGTGTGVAYAYWTTSGEGTGSAGTAAGNPTAFTVRATSPRRSSPATGRRA